MPKYTGKSVNDILEEQKKANAEKLIRLEKEKIQLKKKERRKKLDQRRKDFDKREIEKEKLELRRNVLDKKTNIFENRYKNKHINKNCSWCGYIFTIERGSDEVYCTEKCKETVEMIERERKEILEEKERRSKLYTEL